MRSKEEFKTALWLRYREYTQRRMEKRRKVLRFALPSVACTLLLCGTFPMLLRFLLPQSGSSSISAEAGSYVSSIHSQMEIAVDGEVYIPTDPESIDEVRDTLNYITNLSSGGNSGSVPESFPGNESSSKPKSTEEYTIRVFDSEGGALVYTYCEGYLYMETGKVVFVPDDLAEKLVQRLNSLIDSSKGG